jgi:peptidylprolyl isomerase
VVQSPRAAAAATEKESKIMREAMMNDTVQVHYTGTFEDGTRFDSSEGRDPIQLQIGGGQVIPGFENALLGMKEGDTKNVTLAPDQAYGPHQPQLVQDVPRTDIPAEIELEVGTMLQAQDPQGNPVRLTVTDIADDTVTLDANHPLAGRELTFELTLVGFVG